MDRGLEEEGQREGLLRIDSDTLVRMPFITWKRLLILLYNLTMMNNEYNV